MRPLRLIEAAICLLLLCGGGRLGAEAKKQPNKAAATIKAELGGLSIKQLVARATEKELSEAAVEEALDSAGPKDALIEMLAKLEIKKLPKKAVSLPKQMGCAVCEFVVESMDRFVRDSLATGLKLTEVGWRLLPDGTRRSEKMPWVQTEIGFQELFGPAGAQGKDSQAGWRLCDSSMFKRMNVSKAAGGGLHLLHPIWHERDLTGRYTHLYETKGVMGSYGGDVAALGAAEQKEALKACRTLFENREEALGATVRDPNRMRVYAKTEKKENGFEMVEDWASQDGLEGLKDAFCVSKQAAKLCPKGRAWRATVVPKYNKIGDYLDADVADALAKEKGAAKVEL